MSQIDLLLDQGIIFAFGRSHFVFMDHINQSELVYASVSILHEYVVEGQEMTADLNALSQALSQDLDALSQADTADGERDEFGTD
jgi:hypothetical protein